MKKTINMQLRVPPELHGWLKQHAKENYTTMHPIIIRLIKEEKERTESDKNP